MQRNKNSEVAEKEKENHEEKYEDSQSFDSQSVDSMKHIVKILTLLVAIAALWIGLLQISVIPDSHTWLLPIYFIVSLGCYGLLMVGVGLMQFRTCSEEFVLLQEDILEAKVFLKQKGVDVGNAFVQQYYQILHFTPSLVHKFYQDSSKLGRPNEDSTTTMNAINEKILSLNYDQLVPTIKSVDSQDSLNGGINVLVTGKLSGSDNVIRSFTQTFFLAPQQQGFYVLNDIFRYVEDVSHEVNDEVLVENVDSPDILEKETPTILENGVSEESYVIVGEADIEDAKNPSENEEVPVIEKEMVTVAEVVEEKIPTVVEVVKKVEQQKREIIAESDTKTEETPKKSYASLVMGWKENGAPLSAPTPAVRKSPQKVQAQQVHSNPPTPAAVEAAIPNTDVAENEINHEGEAEGYSIYIKGLPLNTTIPQIDEEFNKFGPIKTNGIQVKSNRQSGICFGFVRYEAESAMQKAIEASPISIGGRQAVIEEKRSTSSRGGYNRGGRFLGGRGVAGEFRNNGIRGGRGSYGGGRGGSYGGRLEFNRGNTSSRGGMGYQRSDSMGSNNGGRYVNRPVTGGNSGGGGFNENTKNMPPRVPATA